MCDNEAFRLSVGGPCKIYAIRILGCRNDEFVAFGKMVFHLLPKRVVNADQAHVFPLDGDESVGWIGGKAEGRDVFVNAVRGFVIQREGIDAEVGVDVEGSVNVFRDGRGVSVEKDGFADGDDHAHFGDVLTFVKTFHAEVLGIASVDDQLLRSEVGDANPLTMRRAAVEIKVQRIGSDDDLFVFENALSVQVETQRDSRDESNNFFHCSSQFSIVSLVVNY